MKKGTLWTQMELPSLSQIKHNGEQKCTKMKESV